MFTKVLFPILLISRVLASPVDTSAPSFNGLGIPSLSGFDDFNGVSNFDGSHNTQVIIVQEHQTVCESVSVTIIQQRLVILQEMIKRIITEQICSVETQTVVIEQLSSGITEFSKTIVRQTEKQVGYDANIASLFSKIVNSDGSLNTDNLGFSGNNVGSNTVVPIGNNWNNSTSPASTGLTLAAAKKAAKSSRGNNSKSSASSSTSSAAASSTASSSATASSVASTNSATSSATASSAASTNSTASSASATTAAASQTSA